MSYNRSDAYDYARRLGGVLVLLGLVIGIALPLFLHSFVGLIIGPVLMLLGLGWLLLAWLNRPRWKP